MVMSESCGLNGVETLIVPSNPGTKTFIPFGIDGTSVIISAYGEILRISQYLAEDEPRIICLGSPTLRGYQRDLASVANLLHELAQGQETGLHVHLRPASGGEPSIMETKLVWINGRWPCISYEVGGLDVSVLFTVDGGILSQRYLIANSSAEPRSIRYTLQAGGAQVNTLHVDDQHWAGASGDEWTEKYQFDLSHSTHAFYISETQHNPPDVTQNNDDIAKITTQAEHAIPEAVQHDSEIPKIATRAQAVIALYHNDELVAPENTFQAPIRANVHDSDGDESDDEVNGGKNTSAAFSEPLHVVPYGVQKLVVQYRLQPDDEFDNQDSEVLHPRDINALVKREESENWSFVQDDEFNPIFRRHLEHILCLCVVNENPNSEQQHHVPFINDITFESGSMPINDFYIFRYLLFMYRILDTDDHIHSNPVSSVLQDSSPTLEKSALQARIKGACKGHLRWCFEKAFLTSQSWPTPKYGGDDVIPDHGTHEEAFVGSLQMLKLFEFSRIFEEESSLVNECLVRGSKIWLDAMNAKQDEKSKLWYTHTKTEYLESGLDGGTEWLYLPDYRLGDLIYIWKALKSLEDLVSKSDNEAFRMSILEKLNEFKLRHYDVRRTILCHFLHEPPDDRPAQTSSVEESRPNASSFSVAVRRSRKRDKVQFTTKDTMLYDGYEWGFFRNDLDIEVLSDNLETVKANVELSWKNTLKAQGDDYREEIWEKLLRYALAIILAGSGLGSLDSSKAPEDLIKVSRKRLVDCVLPYGLFAEKRDFDTQLPDSLPLEGIERSAWEIPTLLLRQRFKSMKLVPVEDAPSSLASTSLAHTKRDVAVGLEQRVLQLPNDSISREAKIAMRKKVDMKKETVTPHRKINAQMVFDPPERKIKDWLYPLPDFLDKRPPYKSVGDEFKQGTNSGLENRLDRDSILDPHSILRERVRRILYRGLAIWKGEKSRGVKEAFSRGGSSANFVVDVGRHRRDNLDVHWLDPEDLDEYLRKPRNVESSRKRFHYLAPLRLEAALILYLAAPTLDRRHIAQFYVRHSSFSSHFSEYIHDMADVWTTELHLSFLQLVTVQEKPGDEFFEGESVCDGRHRRFLHRYKGSLFDIYKASVSCRFIGDMGDKYWSGYLLTYLPGNPDMTGSPFDTTNEEIPDPWEYPHRWFGREVHNDQRNVLEPFLVEKMVVEVYRSTKRILASIDDWLEPETDKQRHEQDSTYSLISKVNDRNSQAQYSRRSNDCPDLEDTLVLLDRLSQANVETLRKFTQREKNRFSPNKPRWSEKDEQKHRSRVDNHKRLAERQISLLNDQLGQIQSSLDRIRNLKQELSDNLSLFEARRAARQSENIRVFTYATVIFYPLSFVASVFSMQGAPKYDTTIPFLQATAIALIITLLLVFNAGILAWPLGRLSQEFWAQMIRTARPKMELTSNVFPVPWRGTLSRIRTSDGEDVLDESRYTYLMFLVIYWLVEYPAFRIVLAYDSVTKNEMTSADRIGLALLQVLIAIVLLPLFVAVWSVLVIYSIFHWTATSLKALQKRDTEEQREKSEQEGRKSFADGDDTKASREPKNPEGTAEEKARRERKEKEDRDRKEKGERVRKQVARLINPPKLYEDKIKPYNEKIKALTQRKGKSGSGGSIKSSSSASSQPKGPHRSIWSFRKRGTVADDKEGVQEQEGLVTTV